MRVAAHLMVFVWSVEVLLSMVSVSVTVLIVVEHFVAPVIEVFEKQLVVVMVVMAVAVVLVHFQRTCLMTCLMSWMNCHLPSVP